MANSRNRGQFPSEQAVLKMLYLAVRNLENSRRPSVGTPQLGLEQAMQRSRSPRSGFPRHDHHDHFTREPDAPVRDVARSDAATTRAQVATPDQIIAARMQMQRSDRSLRDRLAGRSWCVESA